MIQYFRQWPRLSLVYILSIVLYLISIIAIHSDTNFSFRWLNFSVWMIAVALPFLIYFWPLKSVVTHIFKEIIRDREEFIAFLFILSISLVVNFAFLQNYPFVAIYDPVRDGGLNAAQIVDGTIKNIFGYGRYPSYSLLATIIPSFFYTIFHNSVLTFRFPAALFSCLDIILLYFLVRKYLNKRVAFWSSLILASFPIHIYYSRADIVVTYNITLTIVVIFLSKYLIDNISSSRKWLVFPLVGLAFGFVSGFHAPVKILSLINLLLISIFIFGQIIRHKLSNITALGIGLILIFFIIGYGPKILFTSPSLFLQAQELPIAKTSMSNQQLNLNLGQLILNYQMSLRVYFDSPTISTFYPDFKPLLPPFLAVLFLLGFIYSLFVSKKYYLVYLCFLALIIPFTNSAITNGINIEYRIIPLLAISAILCALGINLVLSLIKLINLQVATLTRFFLIILILSQIFNFFWQESASKQYTTIDYLSMHTIYFLKDSPQYQKIDKICLFVSLDNYDYFNLMDVQEQYQYFLSNHSFQIYRSVLVQDHEIFISTSCNIDTLQNLSNFNKYNFCLQNEKFVCLRNTPLFIYVEKGFPQISKTGDPKSNSAQQPADSVILIPRLPALIP